MPYCAVTLPNGVRFSLLPPSTDYSAAECDVYRWARRGKNGNVMRSSGLKPMNDTDRKTEQWRRIYRKNKAARELWQ
jgi:hypothetical protein